MSAGFFKPRMCHAVVVRNSDSKVIATFAWPYRGWERDNFISSMRSAKVGASINEASNMPFWMKFVGATETCKIWAVVGYRDLIPVGAVFTSSAWGSLPELVSRARWPIRDVPSGTYNFTVRFDGVTTVTVDVPLDTESGNLIEVVRSLNNNVGFSAVAEAFSVGFGEAGRLAIRVTGVGGSVRSIEVIAGGANDASVLLGFAPEFENMREFGVDAIDCGTFNSESGIKVSTGT